jgi:hypothetical protein
MAGAIEGFPVLIQGLNFVPGSAGTGSSILLNGVARPTTCSTATTCAIALTPADLQTAATFTLQISNPGAPALLSNPAPFVVLPFDVSEDVIALNPSQPTAVKKDIAVVEPTTAAVSVPLDVDFDGLLTNATCEVEGTPITVTRPLSGTQTVSLCIHGNGLDPDDLRIHRHRRISRRHPRHRISRHRLFPQYHRTRSANFEHNCPRRPHPLYHFAQ